MTDPHKLDLRVYVDLDNDGGWDELPQTDVMGMTVMSGLSDFVDSRIANVGQCTLRLKNTSRHYSPPNAASPYYNRLIFGRAIRIDMESSTLNTTIFRGTIEDVRPTADQYGEQVCDIEAADAMKRLERTTISMNLFTSQQAGAVIRKILSQVWQGAVSQPYITFLGHPPVGTTFTIGTQVYTLQSTLSVAYDVLRGATEAETLTNLAAAINADYGAGTLYHVSTRKNTTFSAEVDGSDLVATALEHGAWPQGVQFGTSASVFDAAVAIGTIGVDAPVGLIDIEDGILTFDYIGDTWQTDETNAMTAIDEVVRSEGTALFWVTPGGVLTFRDQQFIFEAVNAAPALTLTDDHNIQDGNMQTLYNRITITHHPREVQASAVIARKPGRIFIPGWAYTTNGEKRFNPTVALSRRLHSKTKIIPFLDQDAKKSIGGLNIELPPTKTTDYTVYDDINKQGFNYTAYDYVRMSYAIVGSGIQVTFTNLIAGNLWVHDLQFRGQALVSLDPVDDTVEDSTSIAAYGRSSFGFDLPFSDANVETFAASLGDYLLGRYKDPAYRVTHIGFEGPAVVNGVNVHGLGPGQTIVVTETQTGVAAQKYLIIGLERSITAGMSPRIVFTVTRLDDETYWLLGVAGYGELGVTTRLAL